MRRGDEAALLEATCGKNGFNTLPGAHGGVSENRNFRLKTLARFKSHVVFSGPFSGPCLFSQRFRAQPPHRGDRAPDPFTQTGAIASVTGAIAMTTPTERRLKDLGDPKALRCPKSQWVNIDFLLQSWASVGGAPPGSFAFPALRF